VVTDKNGMLEMSIINVIFLTNVENCAIFVVTSLLGLLSLPHLVNFAVLHVHHICLYLVSIHLTATPVLNGVHF